MRKSSTFSFEQVRANIEEFLALRAARKQRTPHVILSIIVMEDTKDELREFGDFWKARGADEILFKPFVTWGGQTTDFVHLAASEERDLLQSHLRAHPCRFLWESVVVAWDGRVVPCCFDYNATMVMGNLNTQSLGDIWNSEAYVRLRREELEGKNVAAALPQLRRRTRLRARPELSTTGRRLALGRARRRLALAWSRPATREFGQYRVSTCGMDEERISTGVDGLDEVLFGGLIPGRTYLISGPPGTGKTTLGWHFLARGVAAGETALYISFAEPEAELRANAVRSGFDASDVHVLDLSPSAELFAKSETYDIFSAREVEQEPTAQRIIEAVERIAPSRVFVDSMTHLRYLASDAFQFRRQSLSFLRFLADRGATVLVTSESTQTRLTTTCASSATASSRSRSVPARASFPFPSSAARTTARGRTRFAWMATARRCFRV